MIFLTIKGAKPPLNPPKGVMPLNQRVNTIPQYKAAIQGRNTRPQYKAALWGQNMGPQYRATIRAKIWESIPLMGGLRGLPLLLIIIII